LTTIHAPSYSSEKATPHVPALHKLLAMRGESSAVPICLLLDNGYRKPLSTPAFYAWGQVMTHTIEVVDRTK
jgi:hypothetical protein